MKLCLFKSLFRTWLAVDLNIMNKLNKYTDMQLELLNSLNVHTFVFESPKWEISRPTRLGSVGRGGDSYSTS